jgi:phosphoglycolate phosphatase
MIRCVVFDFDGTVVLSNHIKREGFFEAVSGFPGGRSHMSAILSNPPGDRYAIFDRFAAITCASSTNLAEIYTNWCEERILRCPERHGMGKLIPTLRAKGINIYLNSSTPETPLCSIISRRYGLSFFDGIYGGPCEKAENLRMILSREGIRPTELVVIGDGTDDWDAANRIGCYFIGVPDGSLASANCEGILVSNIDDIWPLILNGDFDYD